MPLHVPAYLRIVTKSHFRKKNIFCENTNIHFSKNYGKLGKMNARFWKNIYNKCKISLDSFRNLA